MAGTFPRIEQVGNLLGRLTWEPQSGRGSQGGLTVQLATNFKSSMIDFKRTCQYMAEIPKDVFQPAQNKALDLAVKYSSGPGQPPGTYSLKKARKASDYLINIKSGLMVGRWRKRAVTQTDTEVALALYNTARSGRGFNYPLALFTGTRKMRDRPLPQKIDQDISRELELLLQRHRMRVLRSWRKASQEVE
jgi:hypothetical protein